MKQTDLLLVLLTVSLLTACVASPLASAPTTATLSEATGATRAYHYAVEPLGDEYYELYNIGPELCVYAGRSAHRPPGARSDVHLL